MKSSRRRAAFLAALLCLQVPAGLSTAQAQVRLPALGDTLASDFDLGDERRLGDRIMREIRRDPDYLDDPLLTEYLDSIFYRLLDAARQRGDITPDSDGAYAWQPFLVRDKVVNAFALPGGYVGVYLGLIALTSSRDELASVLGHELTHVIQRHIARGMVNSKRTTITTLAAMLLGLLAASRSNNSDVAQAVVVGGQAAMAQGQLNFSRDMEREADRLGMELMISAGYQPAGMVGLFEKMEAATRLNDDNQFPYLRSHPLTIERISEARLRVRPQPAPIGAVPAEQALMQARARVLMEPTVVAWRRAQALPSANSPNTDAARLGALYASALASNLLRDFSRADEAIAAGIALAKAGFANEPRAQRVFALLKVQSEVDRGAAAALPTSLSAIEADSSRPALFARAQAALLRHQARDPAAAAELRRSTEALQTWVTDHRHDALAWGLLAQCAEPLGMRLRALRAQAEASESLGDTQGAIDRLHAAQRAARESTSLDFVESTIIESRLHELLAELKQLKAELDGK